MYTITKGLRNAYELCYVHWTIRQCKLDSSLFGFGVAVVDPFYYFSTMLMKRTICVAVCCAHWLLRLMGDHQEPCERQKPGNEKRARWNEMLWNMENIALRFPQIFLLCYYVRNCYDKMVKFKNVQTLRGQIFHTLYAYITKFVY